MSKSAAEEDSTAAVSAEPSLWLVHRNTLHPALVYRQGVVEDSDDITSVFNAQSLLQSEVYGQYFLAELIGGGFLSALLHWRQALCVSVGGEGNAFRFFSPAQDSNNKVVVAEVGGLAGGLCSFTADVNVAFLSNAFQTEEFDFFVQPEYHDQIKATWVRRENARQGARSLRLVQRRFSDTVPSERLFSDGFPVLSTRGRR